MPAPMTKHDLVAWTESTGRPQPSATGPRNGAGRPQALRPMVAAGSLLLSTASRALASVKRAWPRLPRGMRDAVHAALDRTGVPYVLNYLAGYEATHDVANFAGNLIAMHAEYARRAPDGRDQMAESFKGIMDALVLRNGVRKSTHPMRQTRILTKVLSDPACRLHRAAISVLELPSSTGVTALDNLATLSAHYRIRDYILGDLFFQVLYDVDRQCIFDEDRNLLQVKFKKRFFSIYRPARSGERYTRLTRFWLLPFAVLSRYFRAKYAYAETSTNVPILLVHPDIAAEIGAGRLTAKKLDVFEPIGDRYDVILCFNLLLRHYFPPTRIASAIANLTDALHEQGLLIMGDETSYAVAQKRDGKLVFLKNEGRL